MKDTMVVKSKIFVRNKEFYQQLISISLPIILQNMITIGVNMMDTIMLGKYGEVQLSGSSLANDFINIFQILCMGMGCGAAVLTAQYWGSRDLQNLRKTVTLMLRVMVVVALIFTLVLAFMAPQIMSIYTNDADVIEKGTLYFDWSIPTIFLMGFSITLTQVLRSTKTVKVPLYASIVSFVANIFFNWVFIFGKLGAPEMQIAGAALGTVLARISEFLIIVIYFFFKDQKIKFRIHNIFDPCSDMIKKYFKYSIPVTASDTLLAFGNSAVSIVIGHMGTIYVAAYAIVGMIQRLTTVFTSGIGQAAHTLSGNRIGEGKTEQAQNEAITLIMIAVILGSAGAVFMRAVGPIILNTYDISMATKDAGMHMLNAMAIMLVFQAMQSVLTKGLLRGGGDTFFAMCIDAVFMWIISIPLGWYTGLILHLNVFWVILSLKADWIVKAVLGTIRVKSGKWIKKVDK